jgi:hypothetical protein
LGQVMVGYMELQKNEGGDQRCLNNSISKTSYGSLLPEDIT